jgi:hypothetical protein
MAKQGMMPTRLAKCRIPLCQACVYGKLTRRPWRTKPTSSQQSKPITVTAPGEVVSVDQLESPVLGFIGQMKGILTRKRYKVATIFVDHFSNLSYVRIYNQPPTRLKRWKQRWLSNDSLTRMALRY